MNQRNHFIEAIKNRVDELLIKSAMHPEIIVVNSTDPSIVQHVVNSLDNAKWITYPCGMVPSSLGLRFELLDNSRKNSLLKLRADLLTLSQLIAAESIVFSASTHLVLIRDEATSQEFLRDVAILSARGIRFSAVLFTSSRVSVIGSTSIVDVGLFEAQLEEQLFEELRRITEKFKSNDAKNSLDTAFQKSIAFGISAICNFSWSTCCAILREIEEISANVSKEGLDNRRALESLHKRSALKLIKFRNPGPYLKAIDLGVFPEYIFGLQHKALCRHMAGETNIASIIGDDLPSEFNEMVQDLSFLRWLVDILGTLRFTGPDEVELLKGSRSTADSTAFTQSSVSRTESYKIEEVIDKKGSSGSRNKGILDFLADYDKTDAESRVNDELKLVRDLALAFGFPKNYVNATIGGLATFGKGKYDGEVLTKLLGCVLPLLKDAQDWLDPDQAHWRLTGARQELRSIIAFVFLARRICYFAQSYLKSRDFDIKGAETSDRDDSNKWIKRLSDSVSSNGETKGDDYLQEIFDRFSNDVRVKIVDTIASCRKALGELMALFAAPGTNEADLTFKINPQTIGNLRTAIDKLSRTRIGHVDWAMEKLRFQLHLLACEWAQAEALLVDFKRASASSAQLTAAEIELLESGLLEARGYVLEANKRYQKLLDELVPLRDYVLWSRVHSAVQRTDVSVRKRPEHAAVGMATAFVALEALRNPVLRDYRGDSPKSEAAIPRAAPVFFSFRGSCRETLRAWVKEIRRSLESGSSSIPSFYRLDDDIDIGDDFDSTLKLRLLRANRYVIVLSDDYFQSPWCINEFHEILMERHCNQGVKKVAVIRMTESASSDLRGAIMADFQKRSEIQTQGLYVQERISRLMSDDDTEALGWAVNNQAVDESMVKSIIKFLRPISELEKSRPHDQGASVALK